MSAKVVHGCSIHCAQLPSQRRDVWRECSRDPHLGITKVHVAVLGLSVRERTNLQQFHVGVLHLENPRSGVKSTTPQMVILRPQLMSAQWPGWRSPFRGCRGCKRYRLTVRSPKSLQTSEAGARNPPFQSTLTLSKDQTDQHASLTCHTSRLHSPTQQRPHQFIGHGLHPRWFRSCYTP